MMALASAPQHWSRRYVGLPWLAGGRDHHGLDCWGLVCFAYHRELGIRLPAYDRPELCPAEAEETRAAIDGALAEGADSLTWREEHGRAAEWDVALFRSGSLYAHVGIYLAGGQVLHARRGQAVRISRLDEQPWKTTLVGIYRHRQLGERA
jgi:lipoprotein Spr